MPTENRSSTTEMVSVPREHELKIRQTPLADLLSGLKTGEVRDCSDCNFAVGDTVLLREIDDALDYTGTVLRRTITHVQKHYGLPDHLCVLSYGQPAQHQGEPVALPARKPWSGLLATADNLKGEGWNACLDEIAKLGPLYTHADPGEVERLRAQVDTLAEWYGNALNKLAEAHALLRDICADPAIFVACPMPLARRIDAAISASAEPSAECAHSHANGQGCPECGEAFGTAPVERDDRDSRLNDWFLSLEPGRQAVLREDKWMLADAAFEAGFARAALERKP